MFQLRSVLNLIHQVLFPLPRALGKRGQSQREGRWKGLLGGVRDTKPSNSTIWPGAVPRDSTSPRSRWGALASLSRGSSIGHVWAVSPRWVPLLLASAFLSVKWDTTSSLTGSVSEWDFIYIYMHTYIKHPWLCWVHSRCWETAGRITPVLTTRVVGGELCWQGPPADCSSFSAVADQCMQVCLSVCLFKVCVGGPHECWGEWMGVSWPPVPLEQQPPRLEGAQLPGQLCS